MSTNTREIAASPADVWKVLADGWLYPLWVVGASRMREVDDHWPQVGARLHHSVGSWPLLVDDETEVVESLPHELLEVRAKAWPGGEAGVTLRLEPLDGGARTRVTIEEDAKTGPGRLVPKPLRDLPLAWRNVETLRRLAFVVEGRQAP
ncbi:Polyketide cyclase / dehydrase and lipid transport [Nocardioides dokdonensis FR1436]|uniref:Polyketide cyclase / dehydrase and lipid transport n=1 Tax=Nocardioides dokdonensis FR1436 TaxID=1300347 RepID=A0A1A9GNQ0_9ACTN|nr:SRPBCC family protein [Nocardioides dokdonensis]ANH39223.1 Polyketide cyclase / dehydrase and lipid transport [Nocardioides dokdonensis FR1436]